MLHERRWERKQRKKQYFQPKILRWLRLNKCSFVNRSDNLLNLNRRFFKPVLKSQVIPEELGKLVKPKLWRREKMGIVFKLILVASALCFAGAAYYTILDLTKINRLWVATLVFTAIWGSDVWWESRKTVDADTRKYQDRNFKIFAIVWIILVILTIVTIKR